MRLCLIWPKDQGVLDLFSLKDLGKKWFAFSKMDIGAMEMVAKLEEELRDGAGGA